MTKHLFFILVALLVTLSPARTADDDRILFQRGDALYTASGDGKDTRRLFTIGRPLATLWAPSPDGRRVAWTVPGAAAVNPANGAPLVRLNGKPVVIYIAEITGRRQKAIASTDNLRDRLGHKVTRFSEDAATSDNTTLDALAWSGDGKSLYLSCRIGDPKTETATFSTFVIDAVTGTAVVDASGRWRELAGVTEADARGTQVVGVGSGAASLVFLDLTEGQAAPIPAPSGIQTPLSRPSLSPDGKSIVFARRGSGLWLVDPAGKNYRRLSANSSDDAPRWTGDGKRIRFLAARGADETEKPGVVTDLYEVPSTTAGPRRLILENVVRFYLTPDL